MLVSDTVLYNHYLREVDFFFGVGRKKIDLSSHSSIVWFCSIQVAIAIPTQLAAGHI